MAVPDSNGDIGIISVIIRQAFLLILCVPASAAPVGLPVIIENSAQISSILWTMLLRSIIGIVSV